MTKDVVGKSSLLAVFMTASVVLPGASCQGNNDVESSTEPVRMTASLGCDESSAMLMLNDAFKYESDYAGQTCVSWKRGEAGWLSMDVVGLEFGCYSDWVVSMGESKTADYTVVIDQNDFSEDECGWPGCMCDHNWSFDLQIGDEDRDLVVDIVVNNCGGIDPVRKSVVIKAEDVDLGITCFAEQEDVAEDRQETVVDDFEFSSSGCEEASFMAPPGDPDDPPAATPGYGTPVPCLNWSFDAASSELHLALEHMLGCGTRWIPSVTVDEELYEIDIVEDDDCTDVGCSCPYVQSIDIPVKGEPSLIRVSIEFWTCEEVFRSVGLQADLSDETQGEICDW